MPLERFVVVVLAVSFLGSVAFAFLRRARGVGGLAWTVLQIAVTIAAMLLVLWLLERRGDSRDPRR